MKTLNSHLKKAIFLNIMDKLFVCYSTISLEEEKAFFQVSGFEKPFVIKLVIKNKKFNAIVGPSVKDVNMVIFQLYPYKKISEIEDILHQSINVFIN